MSLSLSSILPCSPRCSTNLCCHEQSCVNLPKQPLDFIIHSLNFVPEFLGNVLQYHVLWRVQLDLGFFDLVIDLSYMLRDDI